MHQIACRRDQKLLQCHPENKSGKYLIQFDTEPLDNERKVQVSWKMFDSDRCLNSTFSSKINTVQTCVVEELEKCKDSTPANIVDALFKFVKKSACKNNKQRRSTY